MRYSQPALGYRLLRPLLFALDAERAHGLAVAALSRMQRLGPLRAAIARRCAPHDERLAVEVLGRRFPSPVGLAAGFDKDGRLVPAFAALGAGSVEVGTVTPRPQPGNPRPRLFRLAAQESLQNALGFNSAGMERVEQNIRNAGNFAVPVGVNVGKGREAAIEVAGGDYLSLIERLSAVADYFVLNVSSPNTPGLRRLEEPAFLASLLVAARQLTPRPLLVKIDPDLDPAVALDLALAAVEAGAAGLVATNTSVDATLLPAGRRAVGGLSGRLLREKSFAMLRALAPLAGRCILVSVGGIDSAAEAYRRLRAGASLVQLYTGLVYRGPGIFRRLNEGLLELLTRDGFETIGEAVGADLR